MSAAVGELESSAICVLGPSRCGTSLTAQLLRAAGIYLGPESELMHADPHQLAGEGEEVLSRTREANPRGLFEFYRMTRLNERILRTLGGSWREPPSLPAGWESSERLDGEREDARALLAEGFAGHGLWGWKDPRNSLTLPFWQPLIPEMRYVICLRDPFDAAVSLRRRDGIALADGVALWLCYLATALRNTAGRARLLVIYERYFENPPAAAGRLARFVGREKAFEGSVGARALAETIDERLWRNCGSSREGGHADRVFGAAASLFRVCELLAGHVEDGGGSAAELDAAADAYARGILDRLPRAAAP